MCLGQWRVRLTREPLAARAAPPLQTEVSDMSHAYHVEPIRVLQKHDGVCMYCQRETTQVLIRDEAGERRWVVIDRCFTAQPKYLTEHRCTRALAA